MHRSKIMIALLTYDNHDVTNVASQLVFLRGKSKTI